MILACVSTLYCVVGIDNYIDYNYLILYWFIRMSVIITMIIIEFTSTSFSIVGKVSCLGTGTESIKREVYLEGIND